MTRKEAIEKHPAPSDARRVWPDFLFRPSRAYTPIPFWFLNGDLTHMEIRRQLHDFSAHGVYGVVLHPRMGLSRRIGYLSPLFFRYIRTAIETAAELDMKIVLYDEGMYPSGSAGGQVVASHPDLASRGLALVDTPLPDDHVLCKTPEGVLVERFSRGTLRGVHFGEDDGEPNAPLTADILNPEAVSRFISLTHEAYYREFESYFGNTIIGFFTDEPSILGRNVRDMMPWTKGFDRIFLEAGGHLEGLTGLFSGQKNPDTDLYERLMLDRESTVYYRALSQWCEDHGISLMGHPHQSDDIEVEKYFHIPGQDMVLRWVAPEKAPGMDSVMGKCSADIARLMGRPRNSNECFGACNRDNIPWYFTGLDMKWYLDWLAVRGVNLFIPHAFYYSLRGKRSGERPPDVGPGNIWWRHYHLWAGYMCRLSCLMTESEVLADLAVLCHNRALLPEETMRLFRSQRSFQYIPESFREECAERDGALFCRGRRYAAMIGSGFPSVSHDPDSVPPDVECNPPVPELRVARLAREGHRAWFLVNEGDGALKTTLTVPTHDPLGWYDLWNNEMRRLETESVPEGRRFPLVLRQRESALIFSCPSPEDWQSLPIPSAPTRLLTNSDFSLVEEQPDLFRKIYAADLPEGKGDLLLSLDGEEMVEAYIDDACVGVAFWPPQEIRVPEALLRSDSRIRLVVTGSLANRYGHTSIFYGLRLFPEQLC